MEVMRIIMEGRMSNTLNDVKEKFNFDRDFAFRNMVRKRGRFDLKKSNFDSFNPRSRMGATEEMSSFAQTGRMCEQDFPGRIAVVREVIVPP